ncbi:unnamed protein product [Protopolystoma xenopodis]|uniref:Uncharacterized protein n=1 Tax=Protopolystoma xenopodis TaxID=117903 RepID=A0A3S4ZYL2_9PLAT|nr:unnamed protein product [Protopolystoma xenopodis]
MPAKRLVSLFSSSAFDSSSPLFRLRSEQSLLLDAFEAAYGLSFDKSISTAPEFSGQNQSSDQNGTSVPCQSIGSWKDSPLLRTLKLLRAGELPLHLVDACLVARYLYNLAIDAFDK